jgi:hypothetical protein
VRAVISFIRALLSATLLLVELVSNVIFVDAYCPYVSCWQQRHDGLAALHHVSRAPLLSRDDARTRVERLLF